MRDSGKAGEWVVNLTMLSRAELDNAKMHMQAMVRDELGLGRSGAGASQSSAQGDEDSDEEDGDDAVFDVQTEEIYLIDSLPDDSESETESEK